MSSLLGVPWQEILPWVAVLIVYLGEKIQQVMLTRVLRGALDKAQAAPQAPVALPAPPLPAPPQIAPAPTPAPVAPLPAPTGPYAEAPWLKDAVGEIGFHETGNNQGIQRYVTMAHCGAEGEPWCAIFACAMLEQAGVRSPRSASSQAFLTDPNLVPLSQPARGAIVVYWRISKSSGQGHVGFYWGEDATHIWTLGGNENDQVQIEALPKSSASFGFEGYFWPKSVALPKSGPVTMPAGSPLMQLKPTAATSAPSTSAAEGVQTRITATVFGGPQSAYGPPINDNAPGVALPYRFADPRPQVKVTNASTGASVVCDIVDIGPWNTNDPYWQTGARPEAESGTDLGQVSAPRHTNGAGIDLTVAAAKAIGIDGKGFVNWSFVDGPDSPKVT